jgi:hypothetical protein
MREFRMNNDRRPIRFTEPNEATKPIFHYTEAQMAQAYQSGAGFTSLGVFNIGLEDEVTLEPGQSVDVPVKIPDRAFNLRAAQQVLISADWGYGYTQGSDGSYSMTRVLATSCRKCDNFNPVVTLINHTNVQILVDTVGISVSSMEAPPVEQPWNVASATA